MPKPPKTPPHSDTEGVNRDARAGKPSRSSEPEPGSALDHAERDGKARPEQSPPLR